MDLRRYVQYQSVGKKSVHVTYKVNVLFVFTLIHIHMRGTVSCLYE